MSDANAQRVMDKVRTLYKEAPEGVCDRLSQLIGSSEIAYLNVRWSDEDRTMHVVVFTRCAVLMQTFIVDRSRLDVTLKGWPRRQLDHVDFSAAMAVNATAETGVSEVGPSNAVAFVHYKNQGPITLLANSTNDPAEFVAFLPSLLAD